MKKLAMKKIVLLVGTLVLAGVAAVAQAADVRFAVQDNSVPAVDKMVVTDQGLIGVGTTTPIVPIHVKGGTYPTTQIISHATTSSDPMVAGGFIAKRNNVSTTNSGLPVTGDRIGYMLFGSIGTDLLDKNAAGFGAYAETTWTNSSFPAYFAIETAAPNAARAEKMRITGSGNVGIGTKTPTQKLEVNGAIRLNTTAVKPTTCDNSLRGVIYLSQGGTGTADTLEVCAKDASGNYAWSKLF